MASKQKGLGVVWGSSISGVNFTGVGELKSDHSNENLSRRAQRFTLYNGDGIRVSEIFWDQMDVLTLRVYPSAGTIAAAKTANVLPDIGAEALVIDDDDADMGTTTPGKSYLVAECSKLKSYNSVCFFDVTLEAPEGVANTYYDDVG